MIKKTIENILRRSHFWRDVGFDELSELYISNMLRTTALGIFMVFVPFFLWQQQYSGAAILAVFGIYFFSRLPGDISAAYFIARFGPKHAMIVSCVLQIITAGLLLTVPQYHWSVFALGIPWGLSASYFFIAYHVEFSKVKHTPRAGSELGHMQAFEKVGSLLGPLLGGVVGSFLGPEYIFLFATLLLFASLAPLFRTAEPVKVHQKLRFKELDISRIKNDIVPYVGLGVENTLCINAWPFYVAVFVLTGSVYAVLGSLTALAVLASIVSAKFIGRIVDTAYARRFLQLNTLLNALTYFVRPFTGNLWGVLAVNTVNEVVTTGYRMPFTKGFYAAADDLPGFRIVYITSLEVISSLAKGTVWLFLALLASVLALKVVLLISFAIAALASLGIMRERFAVYNAK